MTKESAAKNLPDAVVAWLRIITGTVRDRNATYGDSAIDPVRLFSRSSPDAQLRTPGMESVTMEIEPEEEVQDD